MSLTPKADMCRALGHVCFEPKADIQLLEGDYRCSRSTSSKKPLAWLERGGPRIDRPIDREGFGSTLARMTVTGS